MDDGERFAFLNRAVLQLLQAIDFRPDVIHCHDWHTALIPVLLHAHYRHDPFYEASGRFIRSTICSTRAFFRMKYWGSCWSWMTGILRWMDSNITEKSIT